MSRTGDKPIELTLNPDDLTLGQVEFLGDYTGLTVDELADKLTSGSFTPKELVAVVAIIVAPDDPAGEGLRQARQTKVSSLSGSGQ